MSHDSEIIRELLFVKKYLSNKVDVTYPFYMKYWSSSDGEPILPKILTKTILTKNWKMSVFFYCLCYSVSSKNEKCLKLEKCFSCSNLTGSIVDLVIIYINVWLSDRNDSSDLKSLFWVTFF